MKTQCIPPSIPQLFVSIVAITTIVLPLSACSHEPSTPEEWYRSNQSPPRSHLEQFDAFWDEVTQTMEVHGKQDRFFREYDEKPLPEHPEYQDFVKNFIM